MKGGGETKCSQYVKHTSNGVSGRNLKMITLFQGSDKSLSLDGVVTLV